jgi:IS30 family transposase
MKHRNGGPLTLEQRHQISALLKTHLSRGEIAEQVGCSKSTVSRELQRNCDKRDGSYWPDLAQRSVARHKTKARHKSIFRGLSLLRP